MRPTPWPRASTSRPSSPTARACRCTTSPTTPSPVVSSDESVWGTEDALALAFTRRYHRDWRYVRGVGQVAGVGRSALAHRGHAGRHRPDPQRLPPRRRATPTTPRSPPSSPARARSAASSGWRARTAGTRPPPTSGMPTRGCSTRPGGVVDLKTGRHASARPRRPDDQDHHGHAGRRLPDLAAVPRRGHRRRRRAAGLPAADGRLLPHRLDAASTRCSSCTAPAPTASRCSSTRSPPSSATTPPTRRWTPSWRRAPTGIRPIWRACAARASWRPSKPSRGGAGTSRRSRTITGRRQDLGALHAPGLLRVLPAVQAGHRGQPQAGHPQHRRGDEAAAAPDPVHDHHAARAARQASPAEAAGRARRHPGVGGAGLSRLAAPGRLDPPAAGGRTRPRSTSKPRMPWAAGWRSAACASPTPSR